MEILYYILLGVCVLMFMFCVMMLVKCFNTHKNRKIISNAILAYQLAMIDSDDDDLEVFYSDMEDFDASLGRFWDWGYKNMLPPDKFKVIEPFIGEDPLKALLED